MRPRSTACTSSPSCHHPVDQHPLTNGRTRTRDSAEAMSVMSRHELPTWSTVQTDTEPHMGEKGHVIMGPTTLISNFNQRVSFW